MNEERFEIEGFYKDVFEEVYQEILIIEDNEKNCFYLISDGDCGMHFCHLTTREYIGLKTAYVTKNKNDFGDFISNEDGDFKYRYFDTKKDEVWQNDDLHEVISECFNQPYIR
jgi:hypothetical protein